MDNRVDFSASKMSAEELYSCQRSLYFNYQDRPAWLPLSDPRFCTHRCAAEWVFDYTRHWQFNKKTKSWKKQR